jgi:hypothetical protein
MRVLASAMLMIAAVFTAFATPFAGQRVFADSVEAGTVEAGLHTLELCNPDNIVVYAAPGRFSPNTAIAHQPSLTYCFFHSSADIGSSLTP